MDELSMVYSMAGEWHAGPLFWQQRQQEEVAQANEMWEELRREDKDASS